MLLCQPVPRVKASGEDTRFQILIGGFPRWDGLFLGGWAGEPSWHFVSRILTRGDGCTIFISPELCQEQSSMVCLCLYLNGLYHHLPGYGHARKKTIRPLRRVMRIFGYKPTPCLCPEIPGPSGLQAGRRSPFCFTFQSSLREDNSTYRLTHPIGFMYGICGHVARGDRSP